MVFMKVLLDIDKSWAMWLYKLKGLKWLCEHDTWIYNFNLINGRFCMDFYDKVNLNCELCM
jgi:hypothetical protein